MAAHVLIYNGEPAGQFWVPFAEIRMIAAQGLAPQSSKSDRIEKNVFLRF